MVSVYFSSAQVVDESVGRGGQLVGVGFVDTVSWEEAGGITVAAGGHIFVGGQEERCVVVDGAALTVWTDVSDRGETALAVGLKVEPRGLNAPETNIMQSEGQKIAQLVAVESETLNAVGKR